MVLLVLITSTWLSLFWLLCLRFSHWGLDKSAKCQKPSKPIPISYSYALSLLCVFFLTELVYGSIAETSAGNRISAIKAGSKEPVSLCLTFAL